MEVHERFAAVTSHWEAVVEEMHDVAERYRADGYRTVEIHPGDVAVVGPDEEGRTGFDVVAPDDEFDRLESLTETYGFTSYDVFRGDADAMVFPLVALEAASDDVAVFVPLYYERSELGTLRDVVENRDVLRSTVRPLADDRSVTFAHSDPAPFFPGEDAPATA
ncbi:hypothetical protein VB779_00760 [Haloarculaceae archaeon H-GB11]|nr:hypothetical protein [Haloarculaceae archaeon H-GB11]